MFFPESCKLSGFENECLNFSQTTVDLHLYIRQVIQSYWESNFSITGRKPQRLIFLLKSPLRSLFQQAEVGAERCVAGGLCQLCFVTSEVIVEGWPGEESVLAKISPKGVVSVT